MKSKVNPNYSQEVSFVAAWKTVKCSKEVAWVGEIEMAIQYAE
jgi:hypothetical protein